MDDFVCSSSTLLDVIGRCIVAAASRSRGDWQGSVALVLLDVGDGSAIVVDTTIIFGFLTD
jgi:hypothetical protein